MPVLRLERFLGENLTEEEAAQKGQEGIELKDSRTMGINYARGNSGKMSEPNLTKGTVVTQSMRPSGNRWCHGILHILT